MQPSNVEKFIEVTLLGIIILLSEAHPLNAFIPMLVTLLGMVTLLSEAQPSNTELLMLITLSGDGYAFKRGATGERRNVYGSYAVRDSYTCKRGAIIERHISNVCHAVAMITFISEVQLRNAYIPTEAPLIIATVLRLS